MIEGLHADLSVSVKTLKDVRNVVYIWEERLFVNLLVRTFLQEWAKICRRDQLIR
jgi:hypothetical protein